MSKKLVSLFSVITIAVMLLSASVVAPQAAARSVSDMNIFKATKFDAHYRVPNEGAIQSMLRQAFVTLPGASPTLKAKAEQSFISEFVARNPDTPSPWKYKALMDGERTGNIVPLAGGGSKGSISASAGVDRSIKSLVTLVQFDDVETDTWTSQTAPDGSCADTEVSFKGPLHNQVAPPGPRDNNTIWYDDTTPALYEQIYFGEGPNAGVTVHHPNLGTISFKGKTMVNYYLEQSRGKFAPSGEIYPTWFTADHSEAWYGEDSCSGSHNVRAQDLVMEVIAKLQAAGDVNWESFDGNGDGIVDNFTIIHAGAGQEGGGGAQGNFAIWSHASAIGNGADGVLVCEAPAAGCPTRDIAVREYSMDPEMVDLGVIAEEFGHAAFGLPDIYTTDGQGSPSNWAIMESGSWNGQLGGMEPAPFPLWFRYLVGWANLKQVAYDAPAASYKIGQLAKTPAGMLDGLKINLPPKQVLTPNPLGTGIAAWSTVGNMEDFIISRVFDLTGMTAPVLSFANAWSFEEDWDYGYVEASTDGQTWAMLTDKEAQMTTTNPNGNNQGVGLTGEGQATLHFDLAAYAGAPVTIRLRYSTDPYVQWNGWFVDDVALADGEAAPTWTDGFETPDTPLVNWDTETWSTAPFTTPYTNYYLVEWRNNSGFDKGLKWPYATVYSDEDEWEVDRGAYSVPGMLLWYRDASNDTDYTLYDSIEDGPSYGPKHALLVVDSHYWPYEWDNWIYSDNGAHMRLNSRLQPGNAAFTLQPTIPFGIRLGYNPYDTSETAGYLDEPIDQQVFGPQPAVSQFHDSLGYYPGFMVNLEANSAWFWDIGASVVVPAAAPYTTKATWFDKTPAYAAYGIDLGNTQLGSGNPGDLGVQYGLHIAVAGKASDGSYGIIKTWNAPALTQVTMKAVPAQVAAGGSQYFYAMVKNASPVAQKVVVDLPIPAKTRFVTGSYYRNFTNSIHWEGTIGANATRTLIFKVKVNAGVPAGTAIMATARVKDDALGSTGGLVVTTK